MRLLPDLPVTVSLDPPPHSSRAPRETVEKENGVLEEFVDSFSFFFNFFLVARVFLVLFLLDFISGDFFIVVRGF